MFRKTKKNDTFKPYIKIITIHTVSLFVLLYLTFSVISYAKGDFEIPFFPREQDGASDIEIPIPPVRTTENTAEETTQNLNSVEGVMNPENLLESANSVNMNTAAADDDFINAADFADDGDDFDDFNDFDENAAADIENENSDNINAGGTDNSVNAEDTGFETYNAAMRNAGFTVTDGIYEPYIENSGQEYEYKIVKITPQYTSIPSSQSIAFGDIRKSVIEPIMDYFIIRRGEREILCNASGRIIDPNFAQSGMELLKMRDSRGRTVFKKQGQYYAYNSNANNYESIDFDEEVTGNRGIPFMYPSYYGAPHGNLHTYRNENGLWGYMNAETGIPAVWAQNDWKMFNFNEIVLRDGSSHNFGIAYYSVWRRGNQLHFYNEDGLVVNANFDLYAPDTEIIDASHIGFFYFDHGLTRVIERKFIWRLGTPSIDAEREFLIDIYGREFYIPEDYTIRSYSNGMILLEKEGNFGFMNYLGEWKAQPVFTYAEPFFEGVAVIGYGGKKALIDTQGNLLTKLQYDYISNCTGGIIALYERGEGWTILNKVRRQIG